LTLFDFIVCVLAPFVILAAVIFALASIGALL